MESPKSREFREITGAATQQFRDVEGRQSFSAPIIMHSDYDEWGGVGENRITADAGYCYVGALQRDSRTLLLHFWHVAGQITRRINGRTPEH